MVADRAGHAMLVQNDTGTNGSGIAIRIGAYDAPWFHEQGDRSWLVVTRNTVTHEITKVELARDVARSRGRSK